MAASSTTVTRPAVSLMAANGVTEPGSTPSSSRISSAEPNENRPVAPSSRCSDLSSMTASSSATTRYGAPFLSRRNRFLVCPPAIAPRSARASSTVKTGGWVTVLCAMPRRIQIGEKLVGRGRHWRFHRPPRPAVAKPGALWHSNAAVRLMPDSRLTLLGCGCSSGVEHNLAKVGVEGSNPFARSKNAGLFNNS